MKIKLIAKICCLALSSIIVSALIFYFAPLNPDNYLAGFTVKHRRLDSQKPPRLIITGDSNVAYDIDSRKLQKTFNVNVVNMGLHVGLGYRFQINEIKPYIQAGDTILLIYEYIILQYDGNGEGGLPELTVSDPGAFRYFKPQNIPAFILHYPEALQRRVKALFAPKSNLLRKSSFDEYGDVMSEALQRPPIITWEELDGMKWLNMLDEPEKNANVQFFISFINDFIDYCKSKNARVIMSFGPFAYNAYIRPRVGRSVERTAALLRKRMKCPIIGKPVDYLIDHDQMYDTPHHTNYKGRVMYTDKLIENLRPVW